MAARKRSCPLNVPCMNGDDRGLDGTDGFAALALSIRTVESHPRDQGRPPGVTKPEEPISLTRRTRLNARSGTISLP